MADPTGRVVSVLSIFLVVGLITLHVTGFGGERISKVPMKVRLCSREERKSALEAEMRNLKIIVDRNTYCIGEDIQIQIYFVNDLRDEMSLPSLSYGLEISGPRGEIALSMMQVSATTGPINVKPYSELLIGSIVWNQKQSDGVQVPVGTYTIRANLIHALYSCESIVVISGFEWDPQTS